MRFKYILVAAMLLMLTSCVNKDQLPENPKDKQEYVDKNGNRWIYDYMLMRWAMTPVNGSAPYYFYPSSNRWTNHSGSTVSQPSSVHSSTVKSKSTSTTNSSSSRPANTGRSFGSSHPSSHGS